MPRSAWPDFEGDLRHVLEHAGFVEISHHPERDEPWAVVLSLSPWDVHRLTWFRSRTLGGALTLAICGLELLGAPVRLAEGV